MEDLLARGAQGSGQAAGLLVAPEAERMVEGLRQHELEQIGSPAWIEQQGHVEKLNVQSHHNAKACADEFVKDFLVSYDKVTTLVHELLIMEVWRDKLAPLLIEHLATKVDSITAHLVISHEANLANLLEVTLFYEQALENIDEDHLIELVDWCHRQLQYLNTDAHADAAHHERTAKEMMERSEVEDFGDKLKEQRLTVAACCVTIVRYLSDGAARLPVGILTRLLQTHDTVLALVPLLEKPPWRRERNGSTEQLEGSQWVSVPPTDRLRLSQVWLALNNFAVDPHCRAKYQIDNFRKQRLLRVRRHLNDVLLDQLPVLRDLQRALDELTLNCTPNTEGYASGALIIEQVPSIRANMLARRDWRELAGQLMAGPLAPGAAAAATQARMKEMLAAFEFMVDSSMLPAAPAEASSTDSGKENQSGAASSAALPPVKMVLYRKCQSGAMEMWADQEFAIDSAAKSTPVELQGDKGIVIKGTRWNLAKQDLASSKPLPTQGRAVVRHGSSSAEVLLELPAAETKSKDDLENIPAGMWVTIGLLASDGFALQLKLKRAAKPSQRDKVEGTWYAYHAVGGAITVLDKVVEPEAPAGNTPKIEPVFQLD